jgi:hypothetical protein
VAAAEYVVYVSSDGKTWTEHKGVGVGEVTSIAWVNNQFALASYTVDEYAYTYTSSDYRIMTSEDGSTWTAHTLPIGGDYSSLAWGNGKYATVNVKTILASEDGETWTAKYSGLANYLNSVVFGDGRFIAVGDAGCVVTSTDWTDWNEISFENLGSNLGSVAYGNSRFIAVGGGVFSSEDGITWEKTSGMGFDYATYYVGFIAASGSIEGGIYESSNGISWTSMRKSGSSINIDCIASGNEGMIGVGQDGDVYRYSSNNDEWEQQFTGYYYNYYLSGDADLLSIAYGNGTYVAAAANHRMFRTQDFYDDWIPDSSSDAGGNWVCFGDKKFVVAGDSGKIYVSLDYGVTWSLAASGLCGSFSYVTWGDSQFVALCANDGCIFSSQDGLEWEKDSIAGYSGSLSSAAYGNDRFVAVGSNFSVLVTLPEGAGSVQPHTHKTIHGYRNLSIKTPSATAHIAIPDINGNITAVIYAVNGKKIYETTLTHNSATLAIPVSISPGRYILAIDAAGKKEITGTFVLVR